MPLSTVPSVLFVDDEPLIVDGLRRALRHEAYTFYRAESADEALKILHASQIDVVVSDHLMPGVAGIAFLQQVRKEFPTVLRLLLTGEVDIDLAYQAAEDGTIFRFFTKPCNVFDLKVTIRQGLYQRHLEDRNWQLTQVLSPPSSNTSPVFSSPVMQDLSSQIQKVQDLNATILISGESGTGKTTIARMIHKASPRGHKPFIVVNCAALPRDLIESELFGYERGAFTGAIATRLGHIELANGGTLFLDEIGDMPLELQPKLLTFLDNRHVTRLGGKESRLVDVRIIAATNQDIAALCQKRLFREDLFFRLNVIPLHMPALRERLDDIPTLVDRTLQRIAQQRGCRGFQITHEAKEYLSHYGWPGNVRELENQLERASALCGEGTITEADFTLPVNHPIEMAETAVKGRAIRSLTLAELEEHALQETLLRCHGNRAAAARLLGVSEKTIYNKLKRGQL